MNTRLAQKKSSEMAKNFEKHEKNCFDWNEMLHRDNIVLKTVVSFY